MTTDEVYILNGGAVGDFLKNSAKIIFAESDMVTDFLYRYFFVEMGTDVTDCRFYRFNAFIGK